MKQRGHPAKGVLILRGQPTIVFLTVCSWRRRPRLANADVHRALLRAWDEANTWMIGAYVIMPDHLHAFCSPCIETVAIEHWVTFWKRQFRRFVGPGAPRFQSGCFHHRLRDEENYGAKWEYVRANPVRAGLVRAPDKWPFQGIFNELRW